MYHIFNHHCYIGHLLEGEGNDRSDIDFPGHQLDLLKDVAASGNGNLIACVLISLNIVFLCYITRYSIHRTSAV